MKVAVVVLGMHRSGTSALTGLISALGACRPANEIPKSPHNPKGYFESRVFMGLNDEILNALGSSWFDLRAISTSWLTSVEIDRFKGKIEGAINSEFKGSERIVIKDPRICRCAPLWFHAIRNLGYRIAPVVAIRHPVEVARSLLSRDGFTMEYGVALWARYNVELAFNVGEIEAPVVDYSNLLRNKDVVANLLLKHMSPGGDCLSPEEAAVAEDCVSVALRNQNDRDWDFAGATKRLSSYSEALYQELLNAHNVSLRSETVRSLEKHFEEMLGPLANTAAAEVQARRAIEKKMKSVERDCNSQVKGEKEQRAQEQARRVIERRDHKKEMIRLGREIKRHANEKKELEREILKLKRSRSWRITAPLRAIHRVHSLLWSRRADVRKIIRRSQALPRNAWSAMRRPSEIRHPLEPGRQRSSDRFRGRKGVTGNAQSLERLYEYVLTAPVPDIKSDLQNILRDVLAFQDGAYKEMQFELVSNLRDRLGAEVLIDEAYGLVALRAGRVQLARRIWRDLYDRGIGADRKAHGPRMPNYYWDGINSIPVVERKEEDRGQTGDNLNICVYTAVFGGYDTPPRPLYKPKGWRFICFTDQDIQFPGWELVPINNSHRTPMMGNREIKLAPPASLNEFDYTLYVDGNIQLVGDLQFLASHYLIGEAFVAWPHPERKDGLEESEAILTSYRHDPERTIRQYQKLVADGIQRRTGLIEASVLWRDMRDRDVRALCQYWRDSVIECEGRDQPVVPFLLGRQGGEKIKIMPEHFGSSRENEFFYKVSHGARVELVPKNLGVNRGQQDSGGAVAPKVKRRTKLCWLIRAQSVQTATLMRGHQLYGEMFKRLEGYAELNFCDEGSISEIKNAIIFVTRSFLKEATVDEFKKMKRNGNIICVDNVDHEENSSLDDYVDVYIAASVGHYRVLRKNHRDKHVQLITHNIDPGISCQRVIGGLGPYLGYFGEVVNAKHRHELQGRVDFIQTNNMSYDNRGWIDRLRFYPVHYAVREPRVGDFVKPFTKGFTAAHVGAVIMTPHWESDARFYLTSDYPYLLQTDDLGSVFQMIDFINETLSSVEGRIAREIMDNVRVRSSFGHIAGEFSELLKEVG